MIKHLGRKTLFLVSSKFDFPYARLASQLGLSTDQAEEPGEKYKTIMQMLVLMIGSQRRRLLWYAVLLL